MSRIVVVGNEEFTLGFELVGIEASLLEKLESLLDSKNDIGIVIISQNDYDNLSIKLKMQIEKLTKPIVVILSGEDIKGNSLREQIIRSLGVDLMKYFLCRNSNYFQSITFVYGKLIKICRFLMLVFLQKPNFYKGDTFSFDYKLWQPKKVKVKFLEFQVRLLRQQELMLKCLTS